MPMFIYSAADRDGKTVKGEREAASEKELSKLLKGEELLLLQAKEKKPGFGLKTDAGDLLSSLKPVGVVDKMFFARNLSVMISAGLSLTRALEALADESSNQRFKKIILDLDNSIVQGKSFAEALRVHEKIFGELFVNMVEVGEASGKLTLVLRLLANQMKKDHDLRKRVRGAMIYPAIIVTALLGVGAFMMIYIVPILVDTIKQLDVELPFTTKVIIAVSEFAASYWFLMLGALLGLVVFFWRILKTKTGKTLFDRVVLKLPLFGELIKKFNVARFCRILAYLVASGVPIVRALEITSSILGNTLFREAIRFSSVEIQKGVQLNTILSNYPELFHRIVIQMISVGEETGKISSMMLRLALFYEEEVTSTTKNLSTVIEPVLMLIVGLAVAFFAISMLQPIYGSLGNIK